MKNLKQKGLALLAMGGAAIASTGAYAVPPTTLTELSAAVDFSEVQTSVLAIAGTLITVYVMIKGIQLIMSRVRGG